MKSEWLGYAFMVLVTVGGVASCYQKYWRGYTVQTVAELCEEMSGGDLHRKHDTGVLRYDCQAIRSDFAEQMTAQLRAQYLKETAGNVSAAPIDDGVSVDVNGRALFITYRAQGFGRPSLVALTSGDDPKSCWDDATRNLFDSVSGDFGFYEPTLTLPVDSKVGPCGPAK